MTLYGSDTGCPEQDAPYKSSRLHQREIVSKSTDYYLTGEIGEPEDYIDLCTLLRNAAPTDEITLRINSGGGSVATGIQIINAINECEGHVRGYIEQECGSMATLIYLACHAWNLSEYAEFFIHTSSGGYFGKESDAWKYAKFSRRQNTKMIKKSYAGFLTDDEIKKVIEGQDFYFDSEQILERLDQFVAYHRGTSAAVKDDIEMVMLPKVSKYS